MFCKLCEWTDQLAIFSALQMHDTLNNIWHGEFKMEHRLPALPSLESAALLALLADLTHTVL